ncbi:cytochrome c oxidase assembly factor 1 homolog isoform X2 [Equus asinus]|uniref:cytochrome c oxidase assembly factor 1 homolog isoform X2 n=1 Tax=Equus asinus TaxID=9793 RepID=UPI0038F7FA57
MYMLGANGTHKHKTWGFEETNRFPRRVRTSRNLKPGRPDDLSLGAAARRPSLGPPPSAGEFRRSSPRGEDTGSLDCSALGGPAAGFSHALATSGRNCHAFCSVGLLSLTAVRTPFGISCKDNFPLIFKKAVLRSSKRSFFQGFLLPVSAGAAAQPPRGSGSSGPSPQRALSPPHRQVQLRGHCRCPVEDSCVWIQVRGPSLCQLIQRCPL